MTAVGEDAQRCDLRTRARPGLRARDERLLSAQAAGRGLGTADARPAPAAKRRRALSLEVFAVGWLVALGAWGLHVGALALAPLSVVQAVLSAGLVFLAVLAERFFGFRLGRRQWTGLFVTAVGLAIIGITQGAQPSEPPGYALAALISIECGVLLLASGLDLMAGRLQVLQAREGLLLGGGFAMRAA
jgi:drug/metabolite transporter (DMT)-like permease